MECAQSLTCTLALVRQRVYDFRHISQQRWGIREQMHLPGSPRSYYRSAEGLRDPRFSAWRPFCWEIVGPTAERDGRTSYNALCGPMNGPNL